MNTPRTDALKKYVSDFPKTVDEWAEWTAQYFQIARQLERELIATREHAEKAEGIYSSWRAVALQLNRKLQAERELRKKAERERDSGRRVIAKLAAHLLREKST